MERMDQASRHMSNARRHLIVAHRSGDAHRLALDEVRLALVALGPGPLDSADALAWVRRLRAAVDGESIDAGLFMDTVDELASYLFSRDLATA
jgi:hypothetical protein